MQAKNCSAVTLLTLHLNAVYQQTPLAGVSVSQWIQVRFQLQVRAERKAYVLHICRQINSARSTVSELNQ